MANTTPSLYMSLPVPVPTVQTGPQYATNINSCLTILDAHTHSSGSGQQITPAGISINQDLPFFNNNAITLRSVRFQAQSTPISQPTDLRCLYSSSADLYYNDSAGNQVRLTQNGGVAGTPGSIANLLSPANVAYISGSQTFVFQSSTATAGNIDAGSIIIREVAAGANGITLSSPSGLPGNYALTFPSTLPTTGTRFLRLDNSGNISDNTGVNNQTIGFDVNTNLEVKSFSIGPSQLTVANFQASSSCGDFVLAAGSTAVITNLNCTVSLSGLRPVMIKSIHDGSINPANYGSEQAISGGSNTVTVHLMRNNIRIAQYRFLSSINWNASAINNFDDSWPNLMDHIDYAPTSGSVTYSLRANSDATANINRYKLFVMEL